MLLSIDETLGNIGNFVNSCLAFLGMDFSTITAKDWATWGLDFGIQLFATLVLFLLVKFKLWKPITEYIEKRQKSIDSKMTAAEEAEKEASKVKLDMEKEMLDAQAKVRQMIDEAEKDALARKEEIINEAKEEAKKRLESVQGEIDQEIKNKKQEIREMIINTAFEAASKIIEREVDKDKYLEVVNQIIAGKEENGR